MPHNPDAHLYSPHAPAVNGEDTSDDELGPNFGILNNLPAPGGANARGAGTSVERVTRALLVYERHHKGYVNSTFLQAIIVLSVRSTTTPYRISEQTRS